MEQENNENETTRREGKGKKFIDLHMIPSKLAYFCIGGIFGACLPFLNIFLTSIGLTTSQAGLITGVSYGVAAVTGPLWGTLADWTGCRKTIYMVLCLGTIGVMFPLPWIANAVAVVEHRNTTCSQVANTTHPSATNNTHCDTKIHLKNPHETFIAMLPITAVATVFAVSLPTYTASVVLNVVKNHKRKATFGQQRVFASISGCIGNVLSGLASDHFISGNMSHYTATFFVLLPYLLCMIPFSLILMKQTVWTDNRKRKDDENNEPNVKLTTHLMSVLKNVDTLVFMISVMISGLAYETFMNFLFLLMDQTLHTSRFVMTLAMTTGGVASIVVFPFASKIIKVFHGPIPCIAIGIFSYSIRYMVMSYTTLPWLMIAIQILQGFGYALSWASILEHTCIISPKEITMTMVTIVGSLHNVASTSIANIFGGFLFHIYGGRVLFRGGAMICGAWSLFMAFYFGIRRFNSKAAIRDENEPPNVAPEMELGPASLLCTPALGRHAVNLPKNEHEEAAVLSNVLKVLSSRDLERSARDVEWGTTNMGSNNDETPSQVTTKAEEGGVPASTSPQPEKNTSNDDNEGISLECPSETEQDINEIASTETSQGVELGSSNLGCDEVDDVALDKSSRADDNTTKHLNSISAPAIETTHLDNISKLAGNLETSAA